MIGHPSIAYNAFSGTAKEVTARTVNGRTVLSVRAKQSKVYTPAQAISKASLSSISRAYKGLTQAQMDAWAALAAICHGIASLGEYATLTAHNLFVRLNCNLATIGKEMITDAPASVTSVPSVNLSDFWINESLVTFIGITEEAENFRLMIRMSAGQSAGTSSSWNKTVIVAPDLIPDWGDADAFSLYNDTIGFTPVKGQTYFIEMYWIDAETGFTGEILKMQCVAGDKSGWHNANYIPRQIIEVKNYNDTQFDHLIESFRMELAKGCALSQITGRIKRLNNPTPCTFQTDTILDIPSTTEFFVMTRDLKYNGYNVGMNSGIIRTRDVTYVSMSQVGGQKQYYYETIGVSPLVY